MSDRMPPADLDTTARGFAILVLMAGSFWCGVFCCWVALTLWGAR